MGPKKDVVGTWQEAAKKQGLKFGVSEHLGLAIPGSRLHNGSDKEGQRPEVPYDGADPQFSDLYHDAHS